jgi:hypothetical protein
MVFSSEQDPVEDSTENKPKLYRLTVCHRYFRHTSVAFIGQTALAIDLVTRLAINPLEGDVN